MNWNHFRAFLWLRWRLRINQVKKAGILNAVILAILTVAGICVALFSFVGALLIGMYALNDVSPLVLMFVWDAVIGLFLFIWTVTLIADLQRGEVLSLDKFLHLPVSLTGAFLINYLSSLLNLRLVLFVPAMVGLMLGLSISRGPEFLLIIPLLIAFLLMITALTNQFQGWLASIMVNKRRRRTVVMGLTFGIVLIAQLPNLVINVIQPWKKNLAADIALTGDSQTKLKSLVKESDVLRGELAAGNITPAKFQERSDEIGREIKTLTDNQVQAQLNQKEQNQQALQQAEWTAGILNVALPPGWLPLGVAALAKGSLWPALLGTAGLGLIGSASLWRSYQTTLRLYTGQFTSKRKKSAVVVAAPGIRRDRVLLLERHLPLVSEQAAAVALGGTRSLARAPEAKMMFLMPFVFTIVFGSMLLTRAGDIPDIVRPFLAFAAMSMILFATVGFVGNQFGFDRSGFRVFVLSGAERRDILLGKNLSFAPFALGLGSLAAIALQCLYPMSIDRFAAVVPQFIAMYLIFCLLANLLSILAPMPITAGTMRPVNPKAIPILLQIVFIFLFPIFLTPTLLPLGIELGLNALGYAKGLPVCLVLTLAEFVTVALLYHLGLIVEGNLLQAREKKILEIVTPKVE